MVIWIINEYAGSPYHGMEFRHYYLGKELVKRGYKIYIITASYSHLFKNYPDVDKPFKVEDIDGLNYVWVKVPNYGNSHNKKRVLKWFVFTAKVFHLLPVSLLDKPDIIIVSPMAPFPVIAAYKWARRLNARIIYEVKDIWPLSIVELGGYSNAHPLIALMRAVEIFGYKKSHRVVSVLPKAFEYFKSYIRPDKFDYIPNGICVKEQSNSGSLLPENIKSRIPDNKFLVTYTGTLGMANALDYLVEAAAILKGYPIHFLLVGSGQEEEKLKNMVKSLNIINVTFLGYVGRDLIRNILRISDVAYIGLRKSSVFRFGVSPNKLFDYMIAGKPIVYAIDSGDNLIEEVNCGITVEAENPEAIAEGILKLYHMSPEERKRLGENGRKYVLEHHTYEKIADRFEEVFKELERAN